MKAKKTFETSNCVDCKQTIPYKRLLKSNICEACLKQRIKVALATEA